ncbi:putative histone-lysine N-methyltransferase (Ash1) [Aspergillus clavatus NRRL 1]|uniref:Histone-lysine N-methyltransferase (Ash1), putative n=1 Tax=Aspergillus clavatus (strain ATCC 1007 / CBS 513.65 / DSM 816 / NCTC 3887 / NRRL 1 / QM 1276 / 107) TaxID=344612 RepID=A1CJB6_ASPCL|nr:histone-lysine N-methyltransferase (Ash1), putative [Aspergillus clavatus NRRL 1]EAW09240.1 histone-lysine N-methyltransferase (Ash1), putative [Aspergillus clavatus NRRL 1]
METRTKSSVASLAIPATFSDLQNHAHEHIDDAMSMDIPEQLLTPENSRSETSSNNENASTEEKPILRRTSSRVTRASLRKSAQFETTLEKENGISTSSPGQEDRTLAPGSLANNLTKLKRSHSSHLRHSIAVMETSLWNETTLIQDRLEIEDHPMAPDTPVSNSSQEPQPNELSTALQHRNLRKRVERALTQDDSPDRNKSTIKAQPEDLPTPRRSTRLSLLEKASDWVEKASSILGKRSIDKMKEGKDSDRRSSLRPRNVAPKEEIASLATTEPPAAKKRRVSESDLPLNTKDPEDPIAGTENAPGKVEPKVKSKRWLTHGLYTGQEFTTSRPSQNRNKSAKRKSLGAPLQRRFLPMPMFAGDRLLQLGRDFQLPFDIYSPLPAGQPKPDEWRKTNKNVFVGEAGSIWRANKHMELSKCMCIEETGCDENCQNRYMFYECDEGNCGLGPDCGNRSFEELKQRTKVGGKYNIGVEVIKTEDRGYGVRSNRTFEPNQVIVEYTGEIITQVECEKRMRTLYKNNECYYLMYFDQNMIIDATRGSIARFVNHSCEPNCRMEKWTVAGKPRMALFAGDRGIMTGEELTYDYNFDPYSQKNVQQCRCGAPNCRGILGPRPREKDQRSKERESRILNQKKSSITKKSTTTRKVTGTKRKSGTALDKSSSHLNKKRRLLAPNSIAKGVRKAVSKARASVSRSKTSAKRTTVTVQSKESKKTVTRGREPAPKAQAKAKESKPRSTVKLPKVKSAKTKVKAAILPKTSSKATTKSPSKPRASQPTSSTLKRPSEKAKEKILRAAKGVNARKQTTKEKKVDTKSPRKSPKSNNAKKTPQAKAPAKRTKSLAAKLQPK